MEAGSAHVTLVANGDAWNALPDDLKALVEKAKDHAYKATYEAQGAASARYESDLKAAGLKIEVAPETIAQLRKDAAQPVWDAFVKNGADKGLPAQEILDLVLNAK